MHTPQNAYPTKSLWKCIPHQITYTDRLRNVHWHVTLLKKLHISSCQACDTVVHCTHHHIKHVTLLYKLYTPSHQACDTCTNCTHTIMSSMWHLYKLHTHHHVKHVTPVQSAHTPSCQACDTVVKQVTFFSLHRRENVSSTPASTLTMKACDTVVQTVH